MIELRCSGTMHGRMDNFLLEVKCGRRSCGAKPGVVVLHTFDVTTGKLVGTKRFADPVKKGNTNGSSRSRAAVRHS
jgi:hypothetical protein